MISWGVQVNDYGNAILDDNGYFIKNQKEGVGEPVWKEMLAAANKDGISAGNFKKLNLSFENRLLAQPRQIRERMTRGVEAFVYNLLTTVFNTQGTAAIALEAILKSESYDPGSKAEAIEKPDDWTREAIIEKAAMITSDKGPDGNFDD